ncbi:MAG TPA: HNH endonuclease signature motif containing protein [Ktedonobacterales bacterium]
MYSIDRTRRVGPSATSAHPTGILVRFVSSDDSSHKRNGAGHAAELWSAASPYQGHPAILPPLPRPAKSDDPSAYETPSAPHTAPSTRPRRKATSVRQASAPAPTRTPPTTPTRPAHATLPTKRPAADLRWPETFDDWMIDIVRRRALRLNSGARRRGAVGSVRAVELGQILERSRDTEGRWHCALCHETVTLNDLSFDHVVALADGGEHAAHNLVPAHRKCNEIKGSEKAQYRTQALDRWLNEWATTHQGATPRGATRHPAKPPVARTHDWRFL